MSQVRSVATALGWTVGGISYICHKSRGLGEGGKEKKRNLDWTAYNFPSISMASTGLAKTVWRRDYSQVLKLDGNPF